MVKIKRTLLLAFFLFGIVFIAFAGITVYQCDNDGVVTTIHEDSEGFTWSIVDYNGEEPELVGSGQSTGAYGGSCPQISG